MRILKSIKQKVLQYSDLENYVYACAKDYSLNLKAMKAYINIFNYIFKQNIIHKHNNEYGYTLIPNTILKSLSKKLYRSILFHLKQKQLIYTNIPLTKYHLGVNFKTGKHIIRGFKIDRTITNNFDLSSGNILSNEQSHLKYIKSQLNVNSIIKLSNHYLNNKKIIHQISKQKSDLISKVKKSKKIVKKTYNKLKSSITTQKQLQQFNNLYSSIYSTLFSSSAIYSIVGNYISKDKFSREKLQEFLNRYDDYQLDYNQITYNKNSQDYKRIIKLYENRKKAKKSGNRIYSWIHSLKSQERKWVKLKGTDFYLVQAFDIKACNFCLLAKLFEYIKGIDIVELYQFQNLLKYRYIYQEIGKYFGFDITNNKENKKALKSSIQHWLNIRKNRLKQGSLRDSCFKMVDGYFQDKFPSIRQAIVNYQQTQHNGKISKAIWMDFQALEFNLITQKICTRLKEVGIKAISIHDAIYLTSQDKSKISSHFIQDLFWKELDFKHLILTQDDHFFPWTVPQFA